MTLLKAEGTGRKPRINPGDSAIQVEYHPSYPVLIYKANKTLDIISTSDKYQGFIFFAKTQLGSIHRKLFLQTFKGVDHFPYRLIIGIHHTCRY